LADDVAPSTWDFDALPLDQPAATLVMPDDGRALTFPPSPLFASPADQPSPILGAQADSSHAAPGMLTDLPDGMPAGASAPPPDSPDSAPDISPPQHLPPPPVFDEASFFVPDVGPAGGGGGGSPSDGGSGGGSTIVDPRAFFVLAAINHRRAFDFAQIDTVVDSNNVRHDTVTGFRTDFALLELDHNHFPFGVSSHVHQVGSDAVITVDSTYEIILKSVSLISLSEHHFLLV